MKRSKRKPQLKKNGVGEKKKKVGHKKPEDDKREMFRGLILSLKNVFNP